MVPGLRLPRRTPRFTADSACCGELADFGFAFAVWNALCTDDSYSFFCFHGHVLGLDLCVGSLKELDSLGDDFRNVFVYSAFCLAVDFRSCGSQRGIRTISHIFYVMMDSGT